MKQFSLLIGFLLLSLVSIAQYTGSLPVTLSGVPSGATAVQWFKDGVAISGANTATYNAITVGNYYATFTDASTACTDDRTVSIVLINNGGSVNLNGSTNNSAGSAYQWYNAGATVPTATTANYTATTGGLYSLRYNNGTCEIETNKTYVFVLSSDTDNDGVLNSIDLDDDNDGILDTEECSATQRFTTTNFPNTGGGTTDITAVTGWSLSGVDGTNPLFSQTSTAVNFNTDNVTQNISQSLGKVYQNSDGLIPVTAVFRMSNSIDASNAASLIFQYGAAGSEVTYATASTTTGTGTVGSINYSNGASGNLTTFEMGNTLHTLTINLPATVVNSGSFKVIFDPSGRNIAGTIQQKSSDDGSLYSVSFQSCQDSDNDNIPNIIDTDSDNDGCTDANEYYNSITASGTDGGAFGTGTPAVNTNGTVTAASYSGSYANVTNSSVSSACGALATGTIDCTKTQIYTAPVIGQAGQKSLLVSINVTVAGCFSPITVNGSGMTLATGFSQICTNTVGIRQFYIPVDYDGSALGTLNFTIGNAGSCGANLTTPPKKAISDVWTLDCIPTQGPSLR